MLICAMELTIHLPDAASLKEKRQVAKSLIARLQRRFGLSAAEVDRQDNRQILVLGIAVVTGARQPGEQILEHAALFCRRGAARPRRGNCRRSAAAVKTQQP